MKALNGAQIATQAKEQLTVLTGLQADTVSSLSKDEVGWRVCVEMVELRRVPNSADLLGCYQVHLDTEGNVVQYKRTRRYNRGTAMEEE